MDSHDDSRGTFIYMHHIHESMLPPLESLESYVTGFSIVLTAIGRMLKANSIPTKDTIPTEVDRMANEGPKAFHYGSMDDYRTFMRLKGWVRWPIEAVLEQAEADLEEGDPYDDEDDKEYRALPVCQYHDKDLATARDEMLGRESTSLARERFFASMYS